jgi:hypothetical protein
VRFGFYARQFRVALGRAAHSLCVHCNECMATIHRGTRCVLVTEPATFDCGAARQS